MLRRLTLPCLIFAGAAGAAVANAVNLPPTAPVNMVTVKIADRQSRKPLPGLRVEVKSSIPVQCLRAPCPKGEQQQWQGTTDADGDINFPASLVPSGAIAFVNAAGTDFAVDVRGEGTRDAHGRAIIYLQHPPAPKKWPIAPKPF
jgi:hypothetical protein